MSISFAHLNPEQQEAVTHGEGPMLILAGAGTGKTRVITSRIAHLLANGHPPEAILAVTFTNKAANEMRERLAVQLAKEQAHRLTISTFHSFCVRLLRSDIDRLGYKPNFVIYDDADQTGLLRKIAGKLSVPGGQKLDVRYVKALIAQEKNAGRLPPPLSDESSPYALYAQYERELKNLNAVDFDDLLNLAIRLLREESAIRCRLQNRYRHLLVDEFQDTNSRQLELLKLLVNDPPNICVVGDDDQSIYGWRGAEINNIIDFERYFPSPKVIRLEQNYRSTEGILHTANGLIRHNPRRRPKNLWSQKGVGHPIQLISAEDEKEEAAYVADQIHALRRDGVAWEQCAVLFRMNLQARPFEEEFRRCKIPYRIIGARSFFDKREVKDLLAWLKSLLNPRDDISLLRALTAPSRGIGDTTIDRAVELSIAHKCCVFDILESQAFQDTLAPRLGVTVQKFVHFLSGWHSKLTAALPPHTGLVREMLVESGFHDYLKQSSLSEKEAEARQESITFLLKIMEERSLTVRDFLDEITLDTNFGENKDSETGVSVITLHAAKGLEFPNVFLVGLEEGLLPHSKSKLENRLDEERRLLYVGITRAMKTLHISWCRSRVRYGRPSPCHPSSFLPQLDTRYIESVDARTVLNRPVSQEVAREGFAAIRMALGQAAQKPIAP